MKKHTGAILSAVLSAVFMLLVPVVWLLGVVFGGMPMVPTLIGLAVSLAWIMAGVCVLRERIREIRSGEEDDLWSILITSREKSLRCSGWSREAPSSPNTSERTSRSRSRPLWAESSKAYNEMMNEARALATKRMVEEAQQLGADAVVNVRYASAAVMAGAAEVIAYGTAVRFKG